MLSRLMTRREQFVIGFLGLAIVAGAAALFWSKRAASRPEAPVVQPKQAVAPVVPKALPEESPSVAPAPREIAVSIQGAVAKPGVYRLEEDSRVEDLVSAAGGLRSADTSDINLAARLVDGTTLTIPKHADAFGEAPEGVSPPAVVVNPASYTISGQGAAVSAETISGNGGGLININRATQAELETLPGIGPKLAQQIIQHRTAKPFGDATELMDVPGIGPQRFEAVRELITIR